VCAVASLKVESLKAQSQTWIEQVRVLQHKIRASPSVCYLDSGTRQ
jgi:hypothetical protein